MLDTKAVKIATKHAQIELTVNGGACAVLINSRTGER
jgi:hypothetical protein